MFDGDCATTETEAYLLGFLYADGSINHYAYGKYRTLTISLAEKDKDYLQDVADIINNAFQTDYKLRYDSKTRSYRYQFLRCGPIEKLHRLGIHHKKTYEDDDFVFANIPDNMKWHFIRGYFDGDGTIGIYQNKARACFVSYNHSLLLSICNFMHSCGLKASTYRDKKYYRLRISGNIATKDVFDHVYQDATFFMKRKHEIYKSIPKPFMSKYRYVGIIKNHSKYLSFISHDGIREYLGSYPSVEEAIIAYNTRAEAIQKPVQQYKGEELYYE